MTCTFADQMKENPEQRRSLYVQSAEYFAVAIQLNRQSGEAFFQRGIVLMKLSQLQPRQPALNSISEAVAAFRRAAELNPQLEQAKQFAESAELERTRRRNLDN
jgi:tetratricopeptide (TPR) repeat protein